MLGFQPHHRGHGGPVSTPGQPSGADAQPQPDQVGRQPGPHRVVIAARARPLRQHHLHHPGERLRSPAAAPLHQDQQRLAALRLLPKVVSEVD